MATNSENKKNNPVTQPPPPEPPAAEKKKPEAVFGQYMYIGPTIPNSGLRSNVVLCGKYDDIKKQYEEEIGKYGGLYTLIVPIKKLPSARKDLTTSGTLLYSVYKEIAAEIENNAKGELR